MSEATALSEIVSIVGEEKMREICQRLGGERVYIPRRVPTLEDVEICQEFNTLLHDGSTCGNAYQTIADAHGVSVRTVQRAISGA